MNDHSRTPPGQRLILNAESIFKTYLSGNETLQVLKGATIKLKQAEMAVIRGASGTGKSTLLHILATLDRPDSGKIEYDGVDIKAMNHKALADFRNLRVGFVYQFHNLLPEFTALENVMMPGLIAGGKKGKLKERAYHLLERVGVSARADHRPNQLSGGEAQRVAVARALFNKPSIVYADEPTGNLDNRTAEELLALFFELNQELGQTFLVATHNERMAGRIGRKFVLENGLIFEDACN